MTSNPSLPDIARDLRGKIIDLSHQSGAAHLGSSLSCADIVTSAYWGVMNLTAESLNHPERDRFILSKGHAATTLYAALAMKGFMSEDLLEAFGQDGAVLAEHPPPRVVPGIEAATGSLGHGLPIGLGMALSGRIQGHEFKVFVLLSDGECNEGSVWEAAMFAPTQKLDNVCVIVDFNKWQATGRSQEVMALDPLVDKWRAFGWRAEEVDGHDIEALVSHMNSVPNGDGRPLALVAHTVKGKGVSFMEDDNNWHYRVPKAEEVAAARKELGLS